MNPEGVMIYLADHLDRTLLVTMPGRA